MNMRLFEWRPGTKQEVHIAEKAIRDFGTHWPDFHWNVSKPWLQRVHTASFWNINIQRTSHDDLTEKIFSLVSSAKLVKWQKCKTALCDLTEKLLVSNFIGRPNLQIILEAKSMDESSWKKILLYQFLFYFFQIKLFSLWMASISRNLDKFGFVFCDKV